MMQQLQVGMCYWLTAIRYDLSVSIRYSGCWYDVLSYKTKLGESFWPRLVCHVTMYSYGLWPCEPMGYHVISCYKIHRTWPKHSSIKWLCKKNFSHLGFLWKCRKKYAKSSEHFPNNNKTRNNVSFKLWI